MFLLTMIFVENRQGVTNDPISYQMYSIYYKINIIYSLYNIGQQKLFSNLIL